VGRTAQVGLGQGGQRTGVSQPALYRELAKRRGCPMLLSLVKRRNLSVIYPLSTESHLWIGRFARRRVFGFIRVVVRQVAAQTYEFTQCLTKEEQFYISAYAKNLTQDRLTALLLNYARFRSYFSPCLIGSILPMRPYQSTLLLKRRLRRLRLR
jgi:hypothetical protein